MFNKVSAIVLFVQDFQTCLTFYRDVLGLEIAVLEEKFAAFKMNGHDFAMQEMAQSANMVGLGVDDFEPQTGKVDRVMLCADVESTDNAYVTLKEKGVMFTHPPLDQSWGYRVVYFHDPEGNLWELRQTI